MSSTTYSKIISAIVLLTLLFSLAPFQSVQAAPPHLLTPPPPPPIIRNIVEPAIGAVFYITDSVPFILVGDGFGTGTISVFLNSCAITVPVGVPSSNTYHTTNLIKVAFSGQCMIPRMNVIRVKINNWVTAAEFTVWCAPHLDQGCTLPNYARVRV